MRALIAVFVVVALGAVVALFPLALAVRWLGLESSGLSAARAEGTIWNGRLIEARFHGLDLGELRMGLRPLALLTGAAKLDVAAAGGTVVGAATIRRASAGIELDALDAVAPTGAVIRSSTPLGGALRVEGMSARFHDGRCDAAEGRVSSDALQKSQGFLGGQGPALSGQARCEGGALVLPLEGAGGLGRIGLILRLRPDGRYRFETRVATADPTIGASLRLAGFAPTADGQMRLEEGRLW